jgi:hypothetical protein
MRQRCILLMILMVVSSWAVAQEQPPEILNRHLNDDTLAVARLNLASLDLAVAGPLLRDWPDPVRPVSELARELEQAFQKLKPLQITEVYLLIGTSGLPWDGLLVIPTDKQEVLEVLTSVWPGDVQAVDGGVIAGSRAVRQQFQKVKSIARPEFAAGLEGLRGTTLQVVIAPSQDARRVLREFLPMLPAELGGGATAEVTDRLQWIGLGANLPPKLEFRLIGQAANVATAQAAQRTIVETLNTLATVPAVKEILPRFDQARKVLTPNLVGNRIEIRLTDQTEGARQLIEEITVPLFDNFQANAARRRTVGNLKQMALAMHNYHDTFKSFPPAASVSKDGKRLLSWRVHLLPYLDGGALYREFHLDEPWDSDHNKRLIEKMPEIYLSLNATQEHRRRGMTTYLVPVGKQTAFEKPVGTTIRDITDGTSNTLMIVDALPDRAVIWTRPDDLEFDPANPWRGVAVPPEGSFWASFCDGSVRRIGKGTTVANLRRYFQMNDGEVIDPE